jgi:hypothetical protein
MEDQMNNFKNILLIAGITITSIAACNYTVGECWPVGQGGGSSEGVTAGGGVIIPTGPSGGGGFGDEPPKQPGDASDSSPKCNEDDEETTLFANCSLRVDYPHPSTHEPGTINVVARVECNRPVQAIEMTLGLARDWQEVASRTFTNSGVASLTGNVATTLPCVPGAYQGAAAARVTFPPTSMPASAILNSNSATREIDCK